MPNKSMTSVRYTETVTCQHFYRFAGVLQKAGIFFTYWLQSGGRFHLESLSILSVALLILSLNHLLSRFLCFVHTTYFIFFWSSPELLFLWNSGIHRFRSFLFSACTTVGHNLPHAYFSCENLAQLTSYQHLPLSRPGRHSWRSFLILEINGTSNSWLRWLVQGLAGRLTRLAIQTCC